VKVEDGCAKIKVLTVTNPIETDEGRVYGGTDKLEPRELSNVPAPEILRSISQNFNLEHLGRILG
jgi:hypothetical protein